MTDRKAPGLVVHIPVEIEASEPITAALRAAIVARLTQRFQRLDPSAVFDDHLMIAVSDILGDVFSEYKLAAPEFGVPLVVDTSGACGEPDCVGGYVHEAGEVSLCAACSGGPDDGE